MNLPVKDVNNFVGFQLTSAGVPVKVSIESRAFNGDRDITGRLRSAGLNPSILAVRRSKAVDQLPHAQKAALSKDELIACENGIDKSCWPAWQTRIQYYWTQHFPAGATVELEQTYQPVVGGNYMAASMDGASNIKSYCGAADGLAKIAAFKKRHPAKTPDDIVLWENRISYILTTANNWSGAIRNFHVAVVTESPEDLLFTCSDGLQPAGPARYEMTRTNFRPEKELDLLILTGQKAFR